MVLDVVFSVTGIPSYDIDFPSLRRRRFDDIQSTVWPLSTSFSAAVTVKPKKTDRKNLIGDSDLK